MATPNRSGFTSLPLDLLVDSILVLLPLRDLLSVSCLCRNLHSTIHKTELVWKRKIAADYRFPIDSTGRITGFKALYRKLRKPQVWVWGQNLDGRLGLNEQDQDDLLEPVLSNYAAVPTPLRLRTAESIGMVDLQAGGWSFHGLDVEGNVWCWGTLDGSSGGRNLQPHRFSPRRREVEPVMLTVERLPKFKAITCGRSHACGISDEGHVYEWHSWSRIAKLVSVPWESTPACQNVAQICASWDFSALLSSDGIVHFWKEPSPPQVTQALNLQFGGIPTMGTVYDLDSRDRIIRCPDLPVGELDESQNNDKICKIACGEDFIICLTTTSKIYKLDISNFPRTERLGMHAVLRSPEEDDEMLFKNSITQAFCLGQRAWEYLPKFCESDELKKGLSSALPSGSFSDMARPKITHISAQYRTFVAYSVETPSEHQPNAKLNSFVFFGGKETGSEDEPKILPDLQQRGVIQVTLGDYHFLALLSNGNILSWGSYSEGALGLGHSSNPHRKLVPLRPLDGPTQDEIEPQYEMGTQVPTAVQSFSGTECRLSDRFTTGGRSNTQNSVKVPSRYVFSVTAAGWHTGCLAFSLEDDEDLDYGLAILEKEVVYSPIPGSISPDNAQSRHGELRALPFINRIPFPNFRIGFAGRFMGGATRERLLNLQAEQGEPETPPDE